MSKKVTKTVASLHVERFYNFPDMSLVKGVLPIAKFCKRLKCIGWVENVWNFETLSRNKKYLLRKGETFLFGKRKMMILMRKCVLWRMLNITFACSRGSKYNSGKSAYKSLLLSVFKRAFIQNSDKYQSSLL